MQNLKLGSKGDAVVALQKQLNALSSVVTGTFMLKVDGVFGASTVTALRNAQQLLRVTVDGIAGPQTLAALTTYLGAHAAASVPATGIPVVAPAVPVGEETPESKVHPAQTREQAIGRYGEIDGSDWPNQDKWMEPVTVPAGISMLTDGQKDSPTKTIRCNKDMAGPLARALQNTVDRECAHELKTYDGCLNIRNVRGSSNLSCHAYGLALDLNCDTNPLGGKSTWSAEFVKCFTDEGFSWGGNFKSRKDPMHFSFAWE